MGTTLVQLSRCKMGQHAPNTLKHVSGLASFIHAMGVATSITTDDGHLGQMADRLVFPLLHVVETPTPGINFYPES